MSIVPDETVMGRTCDRQGWGFRLGVFLGAIKVFNLFQ